MFSLVYSRWCAILLIASGSVFDSSGEEPLSAAQQRILAEGLTAKVQQSEVWTDDEGHVTGLILINHQSLDDRVGQRPGITDNDLLGLARFPRLTAINIESQGVSDRGLAVFEAMPQFRQIGLHYLGKHPNAAASPESIRFLNGKPDIEILEIKHNFRMKALAVELLDTPMPKLWRLVLDTPITPEQTLHLIRLCPNVTELQLHRTRCSAEQLTEIGRLLPKLEVLWWKPRNGLSASHLSALEDFDQLQIFSPQQIGDPIPFERAWDALLKLKSLERLEVNTRGVQNTDALHQLQQARPSLIITNELTRSRNYEGL